MKIFTQPKRLVLIIWLLFPLLLRAQSWQSALAIPASNGNSAIIKIVADGAGGYVVGGLFFGSLTLGSFTLTNANTDVFVARINAAGVWTQAVNAGGSGAKIFRTLALDTNGGVVVAGEFLGPSTTFGSITLTSTSSSGIAHDIFIARLSAAGQWTQAVQAGGPDYDTVADLAVNPTTGTATAVGYFSGGLCTFGTRTLTGPSTGALFVARLDAAGSWAQAVSAVSSGVPNYASGVALDAAGNAVVCGLLQGGGTVQFGSTSLTSTSATAYVARLSAAGTWTQAVQAASNGGFAAAGQVAVDAAGNVVIAGNFRDASVSFGSYTLPYTAASDNLFVARLSSAGVWTQAAQAANSGRSYTQSISLGADGSVWVAGHFGSPIIRFGTTTLTNPSTAPVPPSTTLTTDIFVARLSAAGTWTNAVQAGGLDDDYASTVLLAGSRVLVTGVFGPSAATFGSLTLALTTPGSTAGFLANLGGGVLSAAPAAAPAPLGLAPNPASATTQLTLPGTNAAPRTVLVLDALGREVHRQTVPANTNTVELRLVSLPQGLYVVRCGEATGRLFVE